MGELEGLLKVALAIEKLALAVIKAAQINAAAGR